MSQLPKIDEQNRYKPLSYDPKTHHFITFDEFVSCKAKIVPLKELNEEELKNLVAERHRVGPDYKMSDLNGNVLDRNQVVAEIVKGTAFGKKVVGAEISYLTDFLRQIQEALDSNTN